MKCFLYLSLEEFKLKLRSGPRGRKEKRNAILLERITLVIIEVTRISDQVVMLM